MTTLDIMALKYPHDLLKTDWVEYLVRWDDGSPRHFRVPFKRQFDGENVRRMYEVKYRRRNVMADSRNLARIEMLSEHWLSPVMLVAYRGRLFVKSKTCNQLTLPIE